MGKIIRFNVLATQRTTRATQRAAKARNLVVISL